MATDSQRIAALEAWVDAVIPTLRGLARRAGETPHYDASGVPQPINFAIPDGSDPATAAVPRRATP
jgi:hypothetical protein